MNDAAIGGGRGFDGVLDQAGEAVADGLGLPAVEAEDELVEVVLQVLGPDGAMVGAEQPALGEAEDEVDGRQAQRGVAPRLPEVDRLVRIPLGVEAAVAGPTVGGDGERLGGVGGDEAFEARGGGVRERREAQPAERAFPPLAGLRLDGTRDHCLASRATPGFTGSGAADQGFVDLHPLLQRLAIRPDHRPTDLVQPAPGSAVAAETHLPLQLHRRDAAFAGGDQVDGQEPFGEPGLGLLEHGTGEDRVLPAASAALLDQALLVAPGLAMPAAAAAKPLRPERPDQVGPALGVRAKAPDEGRQRPWQVPQQLVRHRALQP